MGAWIETWATYAADLDIPVAPYVGAWIETHQIGLLCKSLLSHPTWVRGLKQIIVGHGTNIYLVAPYVGAWIETCSVHVCYCIVVSHPTWVRGLKQNLIGCKFSVKVAPYVGAWIETFCLPRWMAPAKCRTLRGCVD